MDHNVLPAILVAFTTVHDEILPAVLVLLVTVFPIGLAVGAWAMYVLFVNSRRIEPAFAEWAQSSGYQVIAAELRVLLRGPFQFRSSNLQRVWRVQVKDAAGKQRTGWVCLGSFFSGLLSNQATTIWDKESA